MPLLLPYALAMHMTALDPAKDIVIASVMDSCRADYQELCKGVKPGGGRIKSCFKQNASRLSTECKESLKGAAGSRS